MDLYSDNKRMVAYLRVVLCVAVVAGFWLCHSGCKNKYVRKSTATAVMIDSLIPEQSHSFRVEYYKDYKVIKVYKEGQVQPTTSYVLCRKDVQLPSDMNDAIRIESPVTRVACLSTTHIGALKLLGARSLIAAAANTNLICDSAVNAMVSAGTIKNAGKDYQPDYEVIAQVKPQVLFSDGESSGSPQMNGKLRALHITIASSRDYFEQEPLARAEWIKFFAAFVDKEKVADSIFEFVKMGYAMTKGNLGDNGNKPTVFCNMPYNGVWYMPCGKNYVAKLITDAGGKFLWNDDQPENGLNLTLNFEQVYERAAKADFWINTATYTTVQQVVSIDPKFKLFKVYQTGNIYNCTKRLSTGGGMDMWETGTFRPDLALSDLALIFHSTSAPDGTVYYKQLK